MIILRDALEFAVLAAFAAAFMALSTGIAGAFELSDIAPETGREVVYAGLLVLFCMAFGTAALIALGAPNRRGKK